MLVLDMGEPMRIRDVAQQLMTQSERRVEIVYNGRRAQEKLHEVLPGESEDDYRPVHPLISHVAVPAWNRRPSGGWNCPAGESTLP